jgi:MYXO-CTERM domain-containing protein
MRATAGLLALAAIASATPAGAVKFRRPFNSGQGVNYGFDHNGGYGCTDFACGKVCYDGHSGTDFPLPLGTEVVAAATGTITATYNGCANYGGLGNTCGGRCGNYVKLAYADGSTTIYCHMQLNSIVVKTGDHVSCGQALGRSASSGNSSGPHLHFGFSINGSSRDPFAGGCSQSTSYWVGQGSYPHNVPSATCESTCACQPGQAQSSGCGNCGTRHRTCGSNCQWGAWSACQGEGECAAGHVETRSCCDCGSQTRQCSSQCSWGGFSPCAGPDPAGGAEACETGEPGICADGTVRCVQGCRSCVRVHDPQTERCDDVDEDCDGIVDNGSPQQMGEPLPRFAARLVDSSFAQAMAAGQRTVAWATFRNEGSETWSRQGMWLVPAVTQQGQPSRLFDPDSWPAFDVAAVLELDTAPGQTATFAWHLRTPTDFSGTVEEQFQLALPPGALLRCPEADVRVAIRALPAANAQPSPSSQAAAATAGPDAGAAAGCGCTAGSRALPAGIWLLLVSAVAGLAWRRRRAA